MKIRMPSMRNKKFRLYHFYTIPLKACPFTSSWRIIYYVLNGLLPSLTALATAVFVDNTVSAVKGLAEWHGVLRPALFLLAIVAFNLLSDDFGSATNTQLGRHMNRYFRRMCVEKRACLEYKHIENNETWDLIARVCDNCAVTLIYGFKNFQILSVHIVTIISVLVLLITQVWWAGLLIISFCFPLLFIAIFSGRRQYNAERESQRHVRRAAYFSQVLSERDGAEERTAFGYTNAVNNRWHEKYEKSRSILQREEGKKYIRMKGTGLVTVLISGVIALILVFPFRNGDLSLGMFIGLVTAAFETIEGISNGIPYTTSELARYHSFLNDLTAFFALTEREGALDKPFHPKDFALETIEFRDMSFRYPETQRYVLKDFNLKLSAGLHYAIVGANGAGKTTLTKLLTGMYSNYEGEILINGRELRDYPLAEIKHMFAVVFQDFARYAVTLRDNVAFGDVNGKPDVENILSQIELGEVAQNLPNGVNTYLGRIFPGGADLSGGEWQRVALARCLASPSDMRILDEPTAALDPMAESRIYELFGRVSAGKSTIFITHRLGAAKLADEIIVIADGHVAEQGNHMNLLTQAGLYAEMFKAQSEWYTFENKANGGATS